MYRVLVDGVLFCDSQIDELAIINPVVVNKVNTAGSFSFTVSPEHPKKELIKRRASVITVINNEEIKFQGIATSETADFFNQKKYVCEGELSYLNDSIQRPKSFISNTARQLLENFIASHNTQVEDSKKFTVGMVTAGSDSITKTIDFTNTMTCIKELVNEYGGYIRVRYADGKKYIDYLAESPHTSDQLIELGKNLLDYSSNIDDTEIATAVLPLGASLGTQTIEGVEDRLGIASVNAGVDYVASTTAVSNYGTITQVITWNDVTDATELKNKAERYLSDSQFENVVINAKAIDFGLLSEQIDEFKVLDQIRVVSDTHGMDRYFMLTEKTSNLNEPEKDTITLGKKEKLGFAAKSTAANSEILKKIEQVPTSTDVQSAINNATNLLKGVEGGYLFIQTNENGQPTALLIRDALENPTKEWRWNLNGLGYSSDGGQTYGTAITMDGSIVADYITSGTMSADRISGGTLELGNQENINGEIKVYNASNQQIGKWDKDGINVTGGTIQGTEIICDSGNFSIIDIWARNANGVTINGKTAIQGDFITNSDNIYLYGQIYNDLAARTGRADCGTSGNYWATVNAINFTQRSDRRMKEDIKDLDDSMLDVVYNLRPRQYRFKEGVGKEHDLTHFGFIAQEVRDELNNAGIDADMTGLYNEAEIDDDEGNKDTSCSLTYTEFIALNTLAIQKQHEEIEALKAEIKALKGEK